jgi:hypothetical protein
VPTSTTSLQPLISHNLSHPRKCTPSLLNSPSTIPLPFWGFNNRPDIKSQSSVATFLDTQGKNSQQFSHLERMLTGLTTCFFKCTHGLTTCFFSSNYPGLLVTINSKASQVQVRLWMARVNMRGMRMMRE